MSKLIEDYGLIGDGETAALVARDGSIDWLCWPRFDDDACFAALVGEEEHGCWRLAPAGGAAHTTRHYRNDTLVLDTDFEAEAGAVRVTDFMPMLPDGGSAVIRIVTGLRGTVPMECDLRLRFDFGSIPPWLTPQPDGVAGIVGPDRVVLRTGAPLAVVTDTVHSRFRVQAGQVVPFVLRYSRAHEAEPGALDPAMALETTEKFWREWIGHFQRPTDWPDAVRRSLITIKALIHPPSGGLVAAPTLGLPERPGGAMNWDYRYCWVRDATFTCCALLNAGYQEEAREWMAWLLRAIGGRPDKMRIVYRVDGSRRLEEWEAEWLPGYGGATPVRIGNAAAGQRQLDIYGEILDSVHVARRAGLDGSEHGRQIGHRLVSYVARIWREPDQGLWESREEPRHYVYSKVMAWTAVDRFLKLHEDDGALDTASRDRLEELRAEIHAEVCRRGFDPGLGHFTQHYDGGGLDASLLLLPLVRFLPVSDPRIAGTIAAIERSLTEDGLVRRYAKQDRDEEGAFIACSCWLADCMVLQERHAEARAQFERVLALRNDLGLLSEEYHLPSRRLVGNFPQALSHLALVNTALGLCGTVLQRGGG